MAEPGGLLSMGSHRVGHDSSDSAAAAAAAVAVIITVLMMIVALERLLRPKHGLEHLIPPVRSYSGKY